MGRKVGWVLVDECWGTGEFYLLRVCACLRRGTPWNCEWHRSRTDEDVLICLVCSDRQLFLCTTPTEGALREGAHMETSHSTIFLTGISGRVSWDIHLHPGRFHSRVFGQHLRYTFRP